MQRAREHYSPKKAKAIELITRLSKGSEVMALAPLVKVRAPQLMTTRKNFKGDMMILVAKNRIASIALRQTGIPDVEDFLKGLSGQNALIFSNLDPFKLYLRLDRNKVNMPARAGDVATDDIMVPAGNTGIPPGPVLGDFKEAGVPTRIETGSIYVNIDTVVAKKGTELTPKLAGLLSRLGLKPIRAGISLARAYWKGHVIGEEGLRIDFDQYRANLAEAYSSAFALALRASYPSLETLPLLISNARRDAMVLMVAAGYVTRESAELILAKAQNEAQALYSLTRQKG